MSKFSARVRSLSNGGADVGGSTTRSSKALFAVTDTSSSANNMNSVNTEQQLSVRKRMRQMADDPEVKEVKKKRKLLFEEFAETTSLHGIKYITNPKYSKLRRFVWLVLFLAAFVAFIIITIEHFHTFFKYDTTSSLGYLTEPNLTFPAVTLCNYNAFKKSAVVDSGWESLIPILLLYIGRTSVPQTNLAVESYQNLSFPEWDVDEMSKRLDWRHRIEDMLLECRWKQSYECGPEDFTSTWTDLGPCFTFNAVNNSQPGGGISPYVINGTASEEGLWLRLNLEQHDYLATPFDTAGFKILIHSRYDVPTFMNPGIIQAAPGLNTNIPLTKLIILSKKHPYVTNCKDGGLKYYNNYTHNTCLLECLAETVLAECGCFLPWMSGGNESVCDFNMTLTCSHNALVNAKCSCNVPCVEERYNTRVSLTATPAQYAIPRLREKYNMTTEDLRNNIVDLYIYFEDMRQVLIEHTEAYDIYALTSDVGGEIGLLLGASILTLFEFIDYVAVYYTLGFSLVKNCYRRITGKRN